MEEFEKWCCTCKHANAAKDDCKYNLECRDFHLWEARKDEPTGAKHDAGKPQIDLLHRRFLEGTAQAMSFGAAKYNRHNWCGGIAYSRIYSALQRHLIAWNDGEDNDLESGLPHLDHAGACLNMLMGMTVLHPELDDRYRREGK